MKVPLTWTFAGLLVRPVSEHHPAAPARLAFSVSGSSLVWVWPETAEWICCQHQSCSCHSIHKNKKIKSIKRPQTRPSPGGAVYSSPCLMYLCKPLCLECLCHTKIPNSAAAGTSQKGEEAANPPPAFFTCGWTFLHSSQQHWASQSVLPRASTVLGWARETTTWKTIISTFSCLYMY